MFFPRLANKSWRTAIAVAGASLGFVASGCSSSPSPLTTTTNGGSTTTLAPSPADEALAKNELLQLSDLPPNWKSSGSASSSSGGSGLTPQQTQQIAACLGMPASTISINSASAQSPTFTDPSGAITVDNQVSVYPTVQGARTDFSTFSNQRSPSCLLSTFGSSLRQQVQSGLQAGQSLGTLSAQKKTFPKYGDLSGALEIAIPLTEGGQVVNVSFDIYVVVKGRSESVVFVLNPASLFSVSSAELLVARSASHLG